ncbi:MAG: 1-acyl-sn-glycerol-3-phosphate acyltransferase [Verrucomicrobia bacterium]|nr:1-acyl-sn-glycerol-3-phosphate acyltransferase [Verrucomicrobiota bacterium]
MKRLPGERSHYSTFYGFGQLVCSLMSRLFFWRSIVGLEHWIDGPALITPNHASFLDPPLLGSACPEQIAYVARKDLFGNPLFRAICFGVGAIPIERYAADFGSMKRVLRTLAQGKKVLLFPEGVRTHDGNFGAAMPGVGFLVYRSQVPVIPVYIHGTYRAWPRHRRFPIPTRTVVVFGEPMRFDRDATTPPTRETYKAIADEIMARIRALKPRAIAVL